MDLVSRLGMCHVFCLAFCENLLVAVEAAKRCGGWGGGDGYQSVHYCLVVSPTSGHEMLF